MYEPIKSNSLQFFELTPRNLCEPLSVSPRKQILNLKIGEFLKREMTDYMSSQSSMEDLSQSAAEVFR